MVNPVLSFKDFIANGKWDANFLSQAISLDLIPSILHHSVLEGGRADEVVWSLTSSGKFSLVLAFDEVHQARCSSIIHSQIWHSCIPPKVSFFMLRMLLGKLPLPDVLCELGIQMPSRCLCCRDGGSGRRWSMSFR